MQQLISLYTQTFGQSPESVEKLSGAGSNRIYYRLQSAGKSVIGAIGTSVEENHAFITIARHFRAKNLRVPEIYAVSEDESRYLQQDLGNRSLFDALKNGRENGGNYSDYEKSLLRRVIAELPRLQILGAQGLDFSVCYPQPEFDEENVLFDLNYFKYCFLKPTGLDFNEVKLQKDFHQFAKALTSVGAGLVSARTAEGGGTQGAPLQVLEPTFMYRDFQARNIMLDSDDNPWFIDFQGGRKGPAIYDLVSFLWQASAKYPQELRKELIALYFENLSTVGAGQPPSSSPVSRGTEMSARSTEDGGTQGAPLQKNKIRLFVLFRTLQVLGAYGFRGYFERKPHFLGSIPPALENLKALLFKGACDSFPYLKKVLNQLVGADLVSARNHELLDNNSGGHFCPPGNGGTRRGLSRPYSGQQRPLVVRIFSFSYKKGIPQDPSGNGGGYVFDCRSTNNPGRYKEYKNLTGLDQPVIDFLEKDGEILRFLESVYKLADFHVQRYIDRGFTHLMFSFGCTGGQHRSVYSAQHVADHLKEKFGSKIKIELSHREQRPQAFILAAGLGTRLKPLTDTMPKALVRVGEKTLLERTIDTLQTAGFQNIVINTHHFAEQIKAFVKDLNVSKDPKDLKALKAPNSLSLTISDETEALLDTGGGLLKARHKFSQARPILIHNVDILSNADLKGLYESHCGRAQDPPLQWKANSLPVGAGLVSARQPEEPAIATLLVSRRETSRYLHFDTNGNLIGWQNTKTGETKGRLGTPYAFSGIHVVSPHIFPLLEEYAATLHSAPCTLHSAKFSITDFYLWACQSHKIKAYVQEDLSLTDVGKIAVLEQLNNQF